MPTIFNESTVTGEPEGNGAACQHLLTEARVLDTAIHLNHLALDPGEAEASESGAVINHTGLG